MKRTKIGKKNRKAEPVTATGVAICQQVFAIQIKACPGCEKTITCRVPGDVAKAFTSGQKVGVVCNGCGQKVETYQALVDPERLVLR